MKKFRDYLKESIVDTEQQSLSPEIFDLSDLDNPKIKQEVIDQIYLGLNKLQNSLNVLDYSLIGSILTKRYSQDSDLDVNVLVDVDDSDLENAIAFTSSISGQTLENTKHPVNFHILNKQKDFDRSNEFADAVFDLKNNKFIRKEVAKTFDIKKYWLKYQNIVSKIDLLKDDLKDDAFDYNQIRNLELKDIICLRSYIVRELNQILDELEQDVLNLVRIYDKIKDNRKSAFLNDLTAKEIRLYGSKNRLPANVIYKLLEKHYYLAFLKKVDDILGDDKKLSKDEAEELTNLMLRQQNFIV